MKLAGLFSDGAVLQRGRPIYVFGEGKGRVRVSFLGEERSAEADGAFCLTFPAQEAGGPYEMTADLDGTRVVVRDVMIGEVILVAGQSNAELPVSQTYDRDAVFAPDAGVRYYVATRPTADGRGGIAPQASPYNEKWTALTSENAGDWSAIGLHTALNLRAKLGVAVGVVACFKGASVIEVFMREEDCAAFPIDPSRFMIDHIYPLYPWNRRPGYLYHTMIEKTAPFQVAAVVWYQGESNRHTYEATYYDGMLRTMISSWRALFRRDDLPFAVVQINFFPGNPPEPGVRAIMDAQARAVAQTEHCALVRIDDMGEWEKIHPENKRQVAERICAALEELVGDA